MPPIILTITMSEDGVINVNGPLQNKILCLGLVEASKQIIINFEPKETKIVRPSVVPLRNN